MTRGGTDNLPRPLTVSAGMCIFVFASYQTALDARSDNSGGWGRGRLSTSQGSSPAGLCWSSTHLVQCGPDEPSWSWTQIWVQAHMPDYCLNWTARSSAIQGGTKASMLQLTHQKVARPSWNRGPFSLKSAIEHWQSSTQPDVSGSLTTEFV